MRKVASILVAALVVAGCGGTASSARPDTAPPSTQAGVSPLRDGSLAAGTYSFLNGLGTIDVPSGWEACCNAFGVLKNDYAGLLFDDITNVIVYGDSCKWKAGPNPEPTGAQAAAAAFAAQIGHQGTKPEATTVAGLQGWRVTLTVPAEQPVTGGDSDRWFTGCDDGQFATWGLKGGNGDPSRYQQGPGQVDTLYLVDVGARTIVLDMVSGPDTSGSDRAELDAMLASVKFS